MMDTVFVKQYKGLQPDREEIRRYAGMPKAFGNDPLMQECLQELGGINGRLCWRTFPILRQEDRLDLGFCRTDSKSLAINLKGCSSLVLVAGTLGIEIDRLLARYGRLSPAKALWFQTIGAAGVEAMCDAFCEDVPKLLGAAAFAGPAPAEGARIRTKPRYSPGFGDFGLDYQPFIFSALECERQIGLTLTDSLLMSPTKSVTALIGVLDEEDR